MKSKGILHGVITALFITVFALTGCESGGGGGTSPTLLSISVWPPDDNIPNGGTLQFTAIGAYPDGSTGYLTSLVTWTSSDPAVVAISNVGMATALKEGSTTITATYGSVSGNTTLTVRAGAASLVSIAVTPANARIAKGETGQFKATGTYSDGTTGNLTTSVTWDSSDTAVATISNISGYNGLATAIAPGSTTITATSGGISGNVTLQVVALEASVINIPETGQTISYATRDDGGLQKGVAWPGPRFTVSGSCVTDNLTGLMWVQTPDITSRTWTDAISYANGLILCGYDDWRLPNVNELESLLHAGETNSAKWLNTQGFSGVNKAENYQWTSTTYAADTGYAWSVVIWNGDILPLHKTTYLYHYAWPVRGEQ